MNIEDFSLGQLRDFGDIAVLIAAASEAGVFGALNDGPRSAAEIASSLDYDHRAVRIVLLALEDTGLVTSEGDRFALSERGARELGDPGAPGFVGKGLPQWLRSIRASTRLGEVLRRGGPVEKRTRARSPERVARFTRAMAAAPVERLERIADLCLDRCPEARSILDLGGGPGHITRAFVARGLRGTLLDTPDIVAHVVDAYGLSEVEGLNVVAADFNRDPLPAGPFDIVLLSNVIHIYDEGAVRALVCRVADVLRPGGLVAIAEFLRGRSSRAGYLALQMLLKSDAGDTYSEEQLRDWMAEAGLGDIRVDSLDQDRQLVTGVRGSALPTRGEIG
jgi:SAM-dependent methyltransferase